LPNCPNSVSVSLPLWEHVVGYEEGREDVISVLRSGYPRFVFSKAVLELQKACLEKFGSGRAPQLCAVLPSSAAARECQQFLLRFCEANCLLVHQKSIISVDACAAGVHAVFYPDLPSAEGQSLRKAAKAFWQHTGRIVSSRQASDALDQLGTHFGHEPCSSTCRGSEVECSPHAIIKLKERVAEVAGVEVKKVHLYPCGMAAIEASYRLAKKLHPGSPAAVFGWPYLDTLKLARRPELGPQDCQFFGRGDQQDLTDLEAFLERNSSGGRHPLCALFTEFPSNPLLKVPPLRDLRRLADKFDFVLIVDDTISTWLNVDFLTEGIADVVVSSLTKLFSGRCNAMGGSLILSESFTKRSCSQKDIQEFFQQEQQSTRWGSELYPLDASALLANSQDFEKRNRVINSTTMALVEWLAEQPEIQDIYYPGLGTQKNAYNLFLTNHKR